MFSILVHRKALKEIDEFPTEDKQRILSAIRQQKQRTNVGPVEHVTAAAQGIRSVSRRASSTAGTANSSTTRTSTVA